MNARQTCNAKRKGRAVKDFRDVHRNLVGLLFLIVIRLTLRLRLVIGLDKLFSLIDGDFPFNVAAGSLFQVIRHGKAIHRLQADGCAPSVGTLALLRLSGADVLLKIKGLSYGLFV